MDLKNKKGFVDKEALAAEQPTSYCKKKKTGQGNIKGPHCLKQLDIYPYNAKATRSSKNRYNVGV